MAGLLGGGGGLRGHGELPLNADINVTSLVDVAFVLLIIFMITAPLLTQGIKVDLPKAGAEPLPQEMSEQQMLVLSIDKSGSFYLNDGGLSYLAANTVHFNGGGGNDTYIGGVIIAETSTHRIEHFGTVGWIAAASTILSLWLAGRIQIVDDRAPSAEEISLPAAAEAEVGAGEALAVEGR